MLILPALALPVTDNEVSVPTEVMFGWLAVVNEPVTVVNTPAAAPMFPTLALPVTLNAPAVVKLPPVTLPVAVIKPPVPKLPTLALPVTLNVPPVERFPAVAVPVTVNEVRVPVEVIFGCAAVVNVPVNRLAPTVPLFA